MTTTLDMCGGEDCQLLDDARAALEQHRRDLDTARAEAAALRAERDHLNSVLERMHAQRDQAWDERDALRAEVERQKMALDAINEIRNSIVRRQSISWSGHIYPLVAALRKAGIEGDGYDSTQARAKAEIDEIKATVFAEVTAEAAALRAEVEALREVESDARRVVDHWLDGIGMIGPVTSLRSDLDALDALRTRKGGA